MPDPFVVAMMFPLKPDPDVASRIAAVADGVEVLWTPYLDSTELRNSKAANGGRDPLGLPKSELSAEAVDALGRAHAILGLDLPEGIAELAPNLRWFQGVGAGHEQIDGAALRGLDAVQTNASGIAAPSIAEFVIARLLQHWKHFRLFEDQQRDHVWQLRYGGEMAGKTLGIVGLGSIGRAVAARARAFDMVVLASRGSAQPGGSDPDVDELYPAAEVDDMLGRCDAVVLALPATPATADFMDARRLALMPQGSVLINVARGVHVVEADLIAALESGHLGAAALDVTRSEPLPAEDPLWDAPNLYLSPHSAASMDRYQENVIALVERNLAALLAGEPMINVV